MNTVLSSELRGKKLTYKSLSWTAEANGAVNGQANVDFTLKTSQPIYIESIYASIIILLNDALLGFQSVDNKIITNDGKLYLYAPAQIILHYQNLVPKPNDIQVVAGAVEVNAAANESKLALAPGYVNPVERVIIGNFGVSFLERLYRLGGAAGGVFQLRALMTMHYALIDTAR